FKVWGRAGQMEDGFFAPLTCRPRNPFSSSKTGFWRQLTLSAALAPEPRLFLQSRVSRSLLTRPLGDDEVNQLTRDDHDLTDRLALEERGDLLVLACGGFGCFAPGIGRDDDPSAQLAVDLHRDLDFVVLQQRGVVARPRLERECLAVSEDFPKFL